MSDLDGKHRVQSLVKRPAVYVHGGDTLRRIAQVLAEEAIGAVLIRGHDGAPAEGLVSERDVVRALADGADPDSTIAEEVMAEELITVAPGDEILDAIVLMLDAEVRHLPVVEDGVHYGVISARDALAALASGAATD